MSNSESSQQEPSSAAAVKNLQALAEVLDNNQLHEIKLEQDGVRLVVRAASTEVVSTVVTPQVHHRSAASEPPASEDHDLLAIVSPMVGVFYRAPSPNDPNFIEIGDKVEVGQTVGLVEAMKVFNEITSEIEGTVVEIKVDNSDLVESGSPLIMVKTL